MGVVLITLTQAKAHLEITYDDRDSDLLLRMEEATDIVVGYIKNPDHGWTDRTVPGRIRAAILLVLGSLWGERGDGTATEPLSDPVKNLLHRDRDPAMA